MINEVLQIEPYQLTDYLNKGYEFVCAITESRIEMCSVSEEVPTERIVTSNSANLSPYGGYQPIHISKQYPVSDVYTKLLVKRTQAAKLLYEKSLKNENNP
jgi:hypothetical protein